MGIAPLTTRSVVLRITSWDKSKAWTSDVAHTRGMLVSSLHSATAISNLEAKRRIKAILSGECNEILLEDGAGYATICHALQSIGAIVEANPWDVGEHMPD